MRALPFLFAEAMANLRRHGLMTAAAVTTICVSLALLGTFAASFYQFNAMANRMLADFEMRVFCRPEADRAKIKAVQDRVSHLPGVAQVQFLSKEDIWAEQTRNYPIDTAGIPNLMNDTLVVRLADPGRADAIAREVRGWHAEVQEVSVPGEEINRVLRLAGIVRNAGIVGTILMLLGAVVVVSNTIRISVFSRRREIRIMQLVGAAPWFIRFPLVFEGLLHGVAGGALAGIVLLALGHYIGRMVQESAWFLVPYGERIDLFRFGVSITVIGALIGALGSIVSIHRYLQRA